MKRIALFCIAAGICFLLVAPSAFAQDIFISGWWKVKLNAQQGDFQTGEWIPLNLAGKRACYLYVSNSPSPYGSAVLVLWDDASASYFREPAEGVYGAYIHNNIVLFTIGNFSEDGVPVVGGTMIFKPMGSSSNPYMMKGYYTVYDRETEGTTDQFVRMGSMSATRIQPDEVPEDAQLLVPAP